MRKTLALIAVYLCLLTPAPEDTTAQVAVGGKKPKIVVQEDVVYGRVQGAGLLADIAHPEGKGPYPVILSVHGGRWYRESKTTHSAIKVRQWAEMGCFAMSIDYRLIAGNPAPACYQD